MSVLTNALPRAGTTVSYALKLSKYFQLEINRSFFLFSFSYQRRFHLFKSKPAACSEPLVGANACSVSLAQRKVFSFDKTLEN